MALNPTSNICERRNSPQLSAIRQDRGACGCSCRQRHPACTVRRRKAPNRKSLSHPTDHYPAARRRQRRVDIGGGGGGRADTAWCSDDGGGGSIGDSGDGGNCHRRLEVGAVHRRAWRSSIAVRRRGRRWSPHSHGGGPPEPGKEAARGGRDTAADPALWPLARAHVTGHVVVSYEGRRAKRPGQWHGKHEAKKKSI